MDFIYAQGQQAQNGAGFAQFLPFILIMFIIYFLMIRPQSKQQKEKMKMRENLKKGDKVITMGGIYGTVKGFKNKGTLVVLNIDKNTDIIINKTAIISLANEGNNINLETS